MSDFYCRVLNVLTWVNQYGELVAVSCVPWVCQDAHKPRMILRRKNVDTMEEGESVVVELFNHHSANNTYVIVRAEEE